MPTGTTPPASARPLLLAGGVVATVAGLHGALAGTRAVPGHQRGRVDPVLDSELRFYGVIYAAFGVRLLSGARRERTEGPAPFLVVFAAGAARALGWRQVGRPSRPQLALLAIELSLCPAAYLLERRGRRARRS